MKVEKFLEIADSLTKCNTIYVLGGYGKFLTDTNIHAVCDQYNYNRLRYAMYKKVCNMGYRMFDCSGLVKGILWGATPSLLPKYATNRVKDLNADGLKKICYGLTDKLGDLRPGMLLFLPGHVGIYAGNGKVIECTPKWQNGVQYTKLTDRDWRAAGYLPYLEYSKEDPDSDIDVRMFVSVLPGDNLTKIAKRCNTTLQNILDLNPQIKNPDIIHPGDQIRIS